MSHFTVMVVGEDYHKELEPFDENIEENPYVADSVSEHEKQRFVEHYAQKNPNLRTKDFEEVYRLHGKDWNNYSWIKDADGEWQELSTYNQNSKWDWYVLGGRWSGLIKLKEGAVGVAGESGVFGNDVGIDQAQKKDIANWDELSAYAYLIDGEWHEIGSMGWWGMHDENISKEEWEAEVKEIKDSIPDDALISIVDCHI